MDLDELLDKAEKQRSKAEDYSLIAHFYALEHQIKHFTQEKDKSFLSGGDNLIDKETSFEAERCYHSAMEYFRQGDIATAARVCTVGIEANPHDFRLYTLMGYLQMERGEYKEAKLSFQQATQNGRNNYYKALGTLLLSRFYACYSNIGEAIRLAKIAIDRYPAVEEADYILAALYAQKGDVKAACEKAGEILEVNSSYYAGFFFDKEFESIKPDLLSHIKAKIMAVKELSGGQAEEASRMIQEAKESEAAFYDPVKFKTASAKLNYSRVRLKRNNLIGILEANRLINESYRNALRSKETTVTKKVILKKKLKVIHKGVSVFALAAAGWGAVAGGSIGILKTITQGQEHSNMIFPYAIMGFLITFLAIKIANLMPSRERLLRNIIKEIKEMDVHSDEAIMELQAIDSEGELQETKSR
jgi:tetratricopeptide (TPR) repeat protein